MSDVCPDEVVRDDGQKWGHSASAAAMWRLAVGADSRMRAPRRARLKPFAWHNIFPLIFSRQSDRELSIALQKRYMQAEHNKKRGEKQQH